MRFLYVLLFIATAHAAQAQVKGAKPGAKPAPKSAIPVNNDPCKDIKKEVSEDKTQSDFISPESSEWVSPIVVKRTINTNPEWAVDNFNVYLRVVCALESIYTPGKDGSQVEKIEKHIVVEFDDNSKVVDDSLQISHDFTEDKTEAIRNVYLPVSEDALRSFTTKKITKFSLAGYERTIPADSASLYQHYFQCMKK